MHLPPSRYIRFIIAIYLLFCAMLHVHASEGSQSQQLPNVILVFIDDLGYGDLGVYGHPTIHTPNLDQLAHEGIKMTSFYAAASVCTPSRAALMTGRYPLNAGMPGNLGPDSPGGLSLEERTLAEALKTKGYQTAAYGKWHLGAVKGYMPTDRGFDEYLGLLYSNDMIPPWVNTQRPLYLYTNDKPIEEALDQSLLTQRYTQAAKAFIQKNKEEPFFIYLAHSMPHLPIYASEKFEGRSAGGDYGDVIEEIDSTMGEIIALVDEQGLAENTLIIFTSDNGPWRNLPTRMFNTDAVEKWHGGSTGPLAGAKGTSYEGGQRVPAIFRWTNTIGAKQVSSELTSTMDIHATILKLAGVEEASETPLDGRDILAVLTEKAPSPHDYFYYFSGNSLEAVRDKRWKLRIGLEADDWTSPEYTNSDTPVYLELFDLKNDPFEQFNLAQQHPQHVQRLKQQMQDYAKSIGANVRALRN
ncbi:sulfatase [Ningiella sp. W23]|uniref:sulfatase family protein n=1 Tax=Ningiella sp. W23 TaxID=3023715 RepID=UPI003756B124